MESLEIFVEVFDSPGFWTYWSIFLITSIQEFDHYTSSEMTSLTTTHCTLLTYSVCVISMSVHCSTAFIENMCILSCVKSSWIHGFVWYFRSSKDAPGAEVYTDMLQKNMTPYITTQVSVFLDYVWPYDRYPVLIVVCMGIVWIQLWCSKAFT